MRFLIGLSLILGVTGSGPEPFVFAADCLVCFSGGDGLSKKAVFRSSKCVQLVYSFLVFSKVHRNTPFRK